MPYLSAPGGSSDSVEVDSITVTAAITAGFGGGGAGGGNPMGGWHATREPSSEEPLFIDISLSPIRRTARMHVTCLARRLGSATNITR